MALVVISAPDELNYTGNPFGFVFETTVPAENILWVQIIEAGDDVVNALIRKEAFENKAEIQAQEIAAALGKLPAPGTDINTVKQIIIRAKFTTGPPPVGNEWTEYTFLVETLTGGHTKLNYALGRRALDTFNLLTRQENRATTPTAKTYIQIGAKAAGFIPFFTLTVSYKDGSNYVHPSTFTLPNTPGTTTKLYDISWGVYNFGGLDPAGAGKEIGSVLLRFNLDTFDLVLRPVKDQKYLREFHWVNRLGGLDSSVFTGAFKNIREIKREITQSPLKIGYTLANPQYSQFAAETSDIWEGSTGYQTKYEIEAAKFMLSSPRIWERKNGQFIPVILTSAGGLVEDEKARLYSFEFSYQYAFDL